VRLLGRRQKTPSLRQELMALPLRAKLRLPLRLLRDPGVPLPAKLLIPLSLVYLAAPLDLAPDSIPVLGQLDDVFVLGLGLTLFLRLCPDTVVRHHIAELRAERPETEALEPGA